MRDRIDVHKQRERYDGAVRILKNDKRISEQNRKLIFKFTYDLQAEGIGLARVTKYLYMLPILARRLKGDFEKATLEDVKKLVAGVNKSDYADWTKSDLRITLKRFYRWLRGLEKGEDPPETRWIRGGNSSNRILPEELLTEDDIEKMALAAENSRDRALVLLASETGGRIAEDLNLRRKHVQFDQYGAILIFSGKTGDRRVRIVSSAPALAQWMNDHPSKNPEAPLWVVIGDHNHGEPLLYDASRKVLRTLAKRAHISKKVNPQAFRHSRASFLANIMTERQMEQYLGWTTGSKMPKVYVHLSGKETDSVLLRLHGIEKESPQTSKPKLTAKTCSRCKQKNSPIDRFCSSCGFPLELQAALEVEDARKQADEMMNLLLTDPEIQQLLIRKLRHILEAQGTTVSSLRAQAAAELQSREVEHPPPQVV